MIYGFISVLHGYKELPLFHAKEELSFLLGHAWHSILSTNSWGLQVVQSVDVAIQVFLIEPCCAQ